MGSIPHPGLVNEQCLKEGEENSIQYLTFLNIRVDWLTFKLISLFSTQYFIQVLHFKNNKFSSNDLNALSNTLKDS
jgi:hypothetical protein